jgi:UDP:flavonoid glycosyltransferase YjiC (YdhE family)
MYSAGAGKPTLCLPNGRDQNDNAARMEALGLGRTLAPDAPPAAISGAIMDMLGDAGLRAASRSFAAGVSRFGDLTHAADLIEREVDSRVSRCSRTHSWSARASAGSNEPAVTGHHAAGRA